MVILVAAIKITRMIPDLSEMNQKNRDLKWIRENGSRIAPAPAGRQSSNNMVCSGGGRDSRNGPFP